MAEFREEVAKLIAEIDVATDRDATLIEDRIKALKALLDDVDKRIVLYDQELAKRRATEDAYAELGRRRLVEARINAQAAQNSDAASPDNEASGQSSPKEEQRAGGGLANGLANGAEGGEEDANEAPPEQKPVLEQIAELYRAGFSPNLIANRLGMSISEVELAIAIAEQRS